MKKTKTLLALLLALTLALACGLTAFAVAPPSSDVGGKCGSGIDECEGPVIQVGITKKLEMPDGTVVPAATFKFDVTGVAGESTGTPPAVSQASITFANGDESAADAQGFRRTSDGTVTTVTREAADVFGGVAWTTTGKFAYDIKEVDATYTTITANEAMVYSTVVTYRVNVYVKQCAECGEYYIDAVGAYKLIKEDGGPGTPDEKGKATPDPDTWTVEHDFSDIEFTNKYMKRTDPDGTDPDTLSISKTTTGDYRDENEYFNFTLALDLPDLIAATFPGPYPVYVYEGASDKTSDEFDAGNIPATFTAAGPNTFKLKHGQTLKIGGLPIGTEYTISEVTPTNYEPSGVITSGGTEADTGDEDEGQTLIFEDQLVKGGGANLAAYTNFRDMIPDGLNINDLPFFAMIAIALAAAVILVAAKARKAKKSYSL